MRIILFLVLFIFLFNTLINKNVLESFLFAIAIAVGITPELLPMIMSITMARGSIRMSKVGVIVKRLSSIPNFGSMDILCTDKTGTLTEDKITLVSYMDIFGNSNDKVFLYTYLNSSHQTGIKNPLDKAVLEYKKIEIAGYKKIEEIPFDFVRKMMSIVVDGSEGKVLIVKGAPEEILTRCTYYSDQKNVKGPLSNEIKKIALDYYMQLSANGHRVLAVAKKNDLPLKEKYTHQDESGLELVGFVAFLDPAKKGVKEVLITGDNELVAKKICTDVGLQIKGILLGSDLDALTDDALRVRAEHTTIFARFSPDEKNRIITVLRNGGHVVGYLGDGINDAPSIKTADVGISVENAVDVAKESADIILTQKNLSSIVDGVSEGRRAFGNTMKYIMMGLSSNFGNMFSMTGAIFFLPFLPMLPVQILLNNLIYESSQFAITLDTVEEDILSRPNPWNISFIKKFMVVFGIASSLFDFVTFYVLYRLFMLTGSAFQTGWFIESFATQVLVIFVIRSHKPIWQALRPHGAVVVSAIVSIAIAWGVALSPLGKIMRFSTLSLSIVVYMAIIVALYLVVVEWVKSIFYKHVAFAI